MKFPDREQRNHVDVFPGMTFFFVKNPNKRPGSYMYPPDPDFDMSVPWTVIAKEYFVKGEGGWWRFLLLGPGPTLKWQDDSLQWIRRAVDPVWEQRYPDDVG